MKKQLRLGKSRLPWSKKNRKTKECTTLAPATIAPVRNADVKHNPNPNPNLNPYPTPNQKPNHYPHSKSLLPEISWQE